MRRRETRLSSFKRDVVCCVVSQGGSRRRGAGCLEWRLIQDPRVRKHYESLVARAFRFHGATGDLGPGFIPHTMLLVVLGINRFVIEEIKSPFRAA